MAASSSSLRIVFLLLLCVILASGSLHPRRGRHHHASSASALQHLADARRSIPAVQQPLRRSLAEAPSSSNSNNSSSNSSSNGSSNSSSKHERRHSSVRSKLRRWALGIVVGAAVGAAAGLLSGGVTRLLLLQWKRRRVAAGAPIVFQARLVKPKMLAFLLDKKQRQQQQPEVALSGMQVLGIGAAGVVYKAILEGGLTVAIKRIAIKPGDASSSFGRHHTIAELETLGRVRHNNVTPLYAYVRNAGAHFLVYKFMARGSLRDALDGKNPSAPAEHHDDDPAAVVNPNPNSESDSNAGAAALTWEVRRRIAVDVVTGLKYLHCDCNPRILHRDLKTTNVLLDADLVAHLGDFGLAKALPDDMTHVTTDVAGTVGYLAPEYHQTCKFTAASDVYSLGVVLGVLLCGREPTDAFFATSAPMPDWMGDLVHTGREVQGIDPELLRADPTAQELAEMKLLMRVVCLCTLPNPADRPTSNDLLMMLNPKELAQLKPMSELILAAE